MADDANPRAVIGDNAPPAFEAFSIHIEDLFEEAKNHLDGAGVQTQAEADAVGKLLDMIRTAAKDADKARAAEKKPHDDAAKAVQAKWKPLLDKADLAVNACKKALAPYLQRLDEEKRAREAELRRQAEEKAKAAAEAARAAQADDLTAQEAAQAAADDAAAAEKAVKKAAGERAHASTGGRAVALRTTYRPELINPTEALKHYIAARPDEIKACLLRLAEVDVREGKRTLPGFTVHEERTVV